MSADDVATMDGAQAAIDRALHTFGRLDALVNNAGILRDRMFVNMTEEEWDAVIRDHLRSHFCATRIAAGHWRDCVKGGEEVAAAVVNVSSTSGLRGAVGQSNYGAAKAGIAARWDRATTAPRRRASRRSRSSLRRSSLGTTYG